MIDENTLESGKEYNLSITNIGNVSGQVKIIFGDKEYYTSVIFPYNSVDMKIVTSVSGTLKFEEDWKTNNTPTNLIDNVLNVGKSMLNMLFLCINFLYYKHYFLQVNVDELMRLLLLMIANDIFSV